MSAIVTILSGLLSLATFVFWLWMLIDCIQKETESKVVWILVIVLVPCIGSLLYYFLRKSKRGT